MLITWKSCFFPTSQSVIIIIIMVLSCCN